MNDDEFFSLMDQLHLFVSIGVGSFVMFVFFRMRQHGHPKSAYVLPLGLNLVLWHSWLNQRYWMLPDWFYDTLLGNSYWFIHEALLLIFVGLSLVPLLSRPTGQNTFADGLSIPENELVSSEILNDTPQY